MLIEEPVGKSFFAGLCFLVIQVAYFDENIWTNDFLEPIANRLYLLRRDKMAKRSKKTQKSQNKLQELVMVALSDNLEQARDYEALLKSNDIPATIKEADEQSIEAKGIAVMVPEEFLDEAHVVIESQDSYDDFYDFAVEDEDDNDYDSDIFDDDF